jgi:hypothetical protein
MENTLNLAPNSVFDERQMDSIIKNHSFPQILNHLGRSINWEPWAVKYLHQAIALNIISPLACGNLMALCRSAISTVGHDLPAKGKFIPEIGKLAARDNELSAPEIWGFEDFIKESGSRPLDGSTIAYLATFATKCPAYFLDHFCHDLKVDDQISGTLRWIWGISDQTEVKDLPDPRIADGQDYRW